jgi:hypothetical protein
MKPSTGAAVRNHRIAVRDRPESLSAFKWNARPPSPEYAFKSAAASLTANRAVLDEAAAVLLTKETLAGEDLRGVAEHVVKATAAKNADSDQFVRLFRSDLAQDSDFKSLTIPISNRPGKRSFRQVDSLASVTVVGQPFLDCFGLVRRMLSPVSSMRWAL